VRQTRFVMVTGNITHQLPWLHVRAEAEEKVWRRAYDTTEHNMVAATSWYYR